MGNCASDLSKIDLSQEESVPGLDWSTKRSIKKEIEMLNNFSNVKVLQALINLINLSLSHEAQVFMGNENLQLISKLMKVFTKASPKSDTKKHVLHCLYNVSCAKENHVRMGDIKLGLIQFLIHIVKEEKSESIIKAWSCLSNLASVKENQIYMGSIEVGFISVLINTIKSDSLARKYALSCLSNVLLVTENQVRMGRQEIGLIPILKKIVSDSTRSTPLADVGKKLVSDFTESVLSHTPTLQQVENTFNVVNSIQNRLTNNNAENNLVSLLNTGKNMISGNNFGSTINTEQNLNSDSNLGSSMTEQNTAIGKNLGSVLDAGKGMMTLSNASSLVNIGKSVMTPSNEGSGVLDAGKSMMTLSNASSLINIGKSVMSPSNEGSGVLDAGKSMMTLSNASSLFNIGKSVMTQSKEGSGVLDAGKSMMTLSNASSLFNIGKSVMSPSNEGSGVLDAGKKMITPSNVGSLVNIGKSVMSPSNEGSGVLDAGKSMMTLSNASSLVNIGKSVMNPSNEGSGVLDAGKSMMTLSNASSLFNIGKSVMNPSNEGSGVLDAGKKMITPSNVGSLINIGKSVMTPSNVGSVLDAGKKMTNGMNNLVSSKSGKDQESKIYALRCLVNISSAKENQPFMGQQDLGLISLLINVASNYESLEEKTLAIHCMSCIFCMGYQNLSHLDYIRDRGFGLIPLLMRSALMDRSGLFALHCLMNIAVVNKNQIYMGSEELGLIPMIMTFLSSTDQSCLYSIQCLYNLTGYLPNIKYMVKCQIINPVLNIFIRSKKNDDIYTKCLSLLLGCCRQSDAAILCRESKGVEILTPHANESDIDGLKTNFLLSFMTGRDEDKLLLQRNPNLSDLILTILKSTLNGLDGNGYTFGAFGGIYTILAALQSLSISDSNKVLLVEKPFLEPLLSVLALFARNAPPIVYKGSGAGGNVGGGGDDIESAEIAIETILQLSFHYVDDIDLRNKYIIPSLKAEETLKVLSSNEKLSSNSKRSISILLLRLQAKEATTSERSETSSINKKRHVMISYSWAFNKDYVVALSEQLSELGVDVWRDEVGSTVVAKMQGDTDDKMAEAIEHSHTVIIFVSRQYNESGNCRQEAMYTNAQYKKDKLKVIFVMLDPSYTTVSPDPISGWLAVMIGDKLWYPLFQYSNIETTSNAILNLLISNGIQNFKTNEPLTQTSVVSTVKKSPLEESWKLLKDPTKVTDWESLIVYLDETGLSDMSELNSCDDIVIEKLSNFLKTIHKAHFLENMKAIRGTGSI